MLHKLRMSDPSSEVSNVFFVHVVDAEILDDLFQQIIWLNSQHQHSSWRHRDTFNVSVAPDFLSRSSCVLLTSCPMDSIMFFSCSVTATTSFGKAKECVFLVILFL